MSSIGDINRGMVALLLVLVLGAGGYLWYSQMYQPAVAAKLIAEQTANTAQQGLAAAKADLQKAKAELEASTTAAGKPDDSVARLQLAQMAIPNKPLLDEAPLVLMTLAERSGIRTTFDAGSSEQGGAVADESGTGPQGSTPIDLQFTAVGSYGEMMDFMDQVERTVTLERGKLHARGRLFNVVSLQIGVEEESLGGDETDTALIPRPGEITFKLIIRMYASTTDNSQAVGDAGAATDAASQPTTEADGTQAADGTSTGTAEGADAASATANPDAAGGTTPATGDTGSGTTPPPNSGSADAAPAGTSGTANGGI